MQAFGEVFPLQGSVGRKRAEVGRDVWGESKNVWTAKRRIGGRGRI